MLPLDAADMPYVIDAEPLRCRCCHDALLITPDALMLR